MKTLSEKEILLVNGAKNDSLENGQISTLLVMAVQASTTLAITALSTRPEALAIRYALLPAVNILATGATFVLFNHFYSTNR